MITRRDVLTVSVGAAALTAANLMPRAVAQPITKTVRILTGFTPGLQDGLARLVAGQMSPYAETIVVENRPGAGGRVAVEAVKGADSDGTAMLFAPLGFMMFYPHVYKTLRYQPSDFIPVSTVASTPTLLTVGPQVPAEVTTLADFIVWCRANPKLATFGTAGAGTTLHFLGTMLGRSAGFDFLHVPYQGSGAIQDLVKGVIASTVMPIGSSLGLIQSGHLRALATTGPRRCPFVPDVPTMREVGYPELEDLTWFAFFLPAKTPAPIVEKLNAAIHAALRTEEVRSGMEKYAVETDAIALGDFTRLIASESDRWKTIVQTVGFVPTE